MRIVYFAVELLPLRRITVHIELLGPKTVVGGKFGAFEIQRDPPVQLISHPDGLSLIYLFPVDYRPYQNVVGGQRGTVGMSTCALFPADSSLFRQSPDCERSSAVRLALHRQNRLGHIEFALRIALQHIRIGITHLLRHVTVHDGYRFTRGERRSGQYIHSFKLRALKILRFRVGHILDTEYLSHGYHTRGIDLKGDFLPPYRHR